MKRVIYSELEHVKATTEHKQYLKLEPKGEAEFHAFGVDYEEFESGPGNFSTAIIELDNGSILNIPVDRIKFIKEEVLGFGFPAPNLDFLSVK